MSLLSLTITYFWMATLFQRITISWNYEDFENWNTISKGKCKNEAKNQSPIDIKTKEVKNLKKINCNNTGLHWKSTSSGLKPLNLLVSNNGHSVKISAEAEIKKNNKLLYFRNQFQTYKDINKEYCFDHLHLHFGGSEHLFDGNRAALELHFVHYSCDYKNLGEAAVDLNKKNIKDKYLLSVIGVMYDVVATASDKQTMESDKQLEKLFNNSRLIAKFNKSGKANLAEGVDLKMLLPPVTKQSFYHYSGSLTTPDCNDNVRWNVFSQRMSVSRQLYDKLRQFRNVHDKPMINNYRPVVKNKNPVYLCHSLTDKELAGDKGDNKESAIKKNMVAIIIVLVIVLYFIIFSIVFVFTSRRKLKNIVHSNNNSSVSNSNNSASNVVDTEKGIKKKENGDDEDADKELKETGVNGNTNTNVDAKEKL